ncbi:putative secreted protein [Corynebacterium kroppenstedtii DSM 44385]|uniref:Putative secreted protein n=1 Tax=Corynebacterium kroppenstedtii (strain DSM 44385 / JCM 11950 / CIP 105744 / CCUG 35717) TaxID=645127 RepID=C4LHT3_CORK4|nr:putative secreted protein [Corynebacterium kroppenstedtii DSM 44385]
MATGVAVGVASTSLLAGCSARPGSAPVVNSGDGNKNNADTVSQQSEKITFAVSDVSPGFNPHLVSDDTPLVDHMASLVLPSPFVEKDDGELELNQDLLDSADVVEGSGTGSSASTPSSESTTPSGAASSQPFTVRYTIASDAQWSDGTPITGADFEYLWKQMISQPGVEDPAGYEAISSVTSTESGHQVDVHFDRPYVAWRSLFTNLLPSHLYRSSSNFQTMLRDSVPVSGNRFSVESIDSGRGIVTLVRNDRYWGSNLAKTDKIVLQAQDNAAEAAEMLRNGQVQGAALRPKATTQLSLDSVPHSVVQLSPKNRYLMLSLNTAAPHMDDVGERARILNSVDRDTVARIAGERMEVSAPHDEATISGTSVPGSGSAFPSLSRPFRIAVDQSDDAAVTAARTVADQLTQAGFPAKALVMPALDIVESVLPLGLADATVAWQSGDTTASALASHYGCTSADRPSKEMDSDKSSELIEPESSTPSSPSSEPQPTSDSAAPSATDTGDARKSMEKKYARAANMSGLCDPEIDTQVREAAEGFADVNDTKQKVIEKVNSQAVSLALLQDTEVFATTPALEAPRLPLKSGELPTTERGGIFVTAPLWTRNEDYSVLQPGSSPTTDNKGDTDAEKKNDNDKADDKTDENKDDKEDASSNE